MSTTDETATWTDDDGNEVTETIEEIPIESIEPNPRQTRTEFDDDELNQLADSISGYKLINPISVRPHPDGDGYQLISGERRWRASQRAGFDTIRAIVRDADETDILEENFIENHQRSDLSPIDEAKGAYQVFLEHGVTAEPGEIVEVLKKQRNVGGGGSSWRSEGISHSRLKEVESIHDALTRMGAGVRRLEDLMRLLGTDSKVQNVEVEKSEDEQLPQTTLSRIGSIDDTDTQVAVHKIVTDADFTRDEASKLVTQVKRASDETKSFVFDTDDEPNVDVLEQVIETVGDETPELQQRVYEKASEQGMGADDAETFAAAIMAGGESTREMWLDSELDVDLDAIAPVVKRGGELSDERLADIHDRLEGMSARHEEQSDTPEAEEREQAIENLTAHGGVNEALGDAECPVCGNGSDHLRWECHDLSVVEAYEILHDRYTELLEQVDEAEFSEGDN